MVCAGDIKIFGGSLLIIKEDAEALVVASKEIGLEIRGLEL